MTDAERNKILYGDAGISFDFSSPEYSYEPSGGVKKWEDYIYNGDPTIQNYIENGDADLKKHRENPYTPTFDAGQIVKDYLENPDQELRDHLFKDYEPPAPLPTPPPYNPEQPGVPAPTPDPAPELDPIDSIPTPVPSPPPPNPEPEPFVPAPTPAPSPTPEPEIPEDNFIPPDDGGTKPPPDEAIEKEIDYRYYGTDNLNAEDYLTGKNQNTYRKSTKMGGYTYQREATKDGGVVDTFYDKDGNQVSYEDTEYGRMDLDPFEDWKRRQNE